MCPQSDSASARWLRMTQKRLKFPEMRKLRFVNMIRWSKEAFLILGAMNSGSSRMHEYLNNPKVSYPITSR